MRIVKTILKTLVYLWAFFWALFMAYVIVGLRLGKINRERCECGGTRLTSNGKLYDWLYR